MKFLTVIAVILLFACTFTDGIPKKRKSNTEVVLPKYGTVRGTTNSTFWSDKRFYSFAGLKYAFTYSENRFQLPKPAYFKKPYSAKKVPFGCPSFDAIDDIENYDIPLWDEPPDFEDCLFLSVYTKMGTLSKHPVIVYLAGHDFNSSHADEGNPAFMLEKNVVLVSVQYRTGPLGFLSTMSEEIPGNVGIHDVIEALRWVKKYISYFNGDPNRVTLIGQYGSAAIIHILTMTPILKDEELFQQVIYQSGSALIPGMTTTNPLEIAEKIGEQLGCDEDDLNECLQNAELIPLLKASRRVMKAEDFPGMGMFTVGGPNNTILPEEPSHFLDTSEYRTYPAIGGVVQEPADEFVPENLNDDELAEMASILSESDALNSTNFPKYMFSSVLYNALRPGLVDILGLNLKYSVLAALSHNAYKDGGANHTYLYCFDYKYETALGDDRKFIFPNDPQTVDKQMATTMVELITSFATDGEPVARKVPKWPPLLEGKNGPFLKIDEHIENKWDFKSQFFIEILSKLPEL